jgi:hypothetical protein
MKNIQEAQDIRNIWLQTFVLFGAQSDHDQAEMETE